jgi:hypothetical protein
MSNCRSSFSTFAKTGSREQGLEIDTILVRFTV